MRFFKFFEFLKNLQKIAILRVTALLRLGINESSGAEKTPQRNFVSKRDSKPLFQNEEFPKLLVQNADIGASLYGL